MYHSAQQDLLHANGISITCGTIKEPLPMKPHDHDFDEIVIVQGGTAVQYINSESYQVSAGDVYIIKGESIHYFSDEHDFKVFNIGFQPWVINDFHRLVAQTPGYAALFNAEPSYRKQSRFSQHLHLETQQLHVLNQLLAALKKALAADSNDLIVTALFMQITGFLCYAYQGNAYKEKHQNPYTSLTDYIDQNFTTTITLDDLSRHTGFSKNGIIAVFKRLYRTTPIQYINTLRVYRAEDLLRSTDMSITQIAFECGFNDSNYFTRTFRTINGMTPRDFRKASRSTF